MTKVKYFVARQKSVQLFWKNSLQVRYIRWDTRNGEITTHLVGGKFRTCNWDKTALERYIKSEYVRLLKRKPKNEKKKKKK